MRQALELRDTRLTAVLEVKNVGIVTVPTKRETAGSASDVIVVTTSLPAKVEVTVCKAVDSPTLSNGP